MKKQILITLSVLTLLVVFAAPVSAGNWWNGFKWDGSGSTSAPLLLTLEDRLTGIWTQSDDGKTVLDKVVADWDAADELTVAVLPSDGGTDCVEPLGSGFPEDSGEIEVCSRNYGNTGWLGVARVEIAGDGVTITAAIAAVNDYYLGAGAAYDNDNARQHVLCQEIGHTLGLDHQNSPRKKSCMNDRWGLTSGKFVSPNGHDYAQLAEIYGTGGGGDGDDGGGGGRCKRPGHPSCKAGSATFEVQHLANGRTILTWITWAPGRGPSD